MKPLGTERAVIAAAEALAATLGHDPNHTVAAAAIDVRGEIHTAVNVYHFTGGPCAELGVLAAAATANAGPLLAIAAAGDGGRGLIARCGRCRQVLLDLHPNVLVAVPTDDGPRMRPIRALLPHEYRFPDANAQRIVRFNQRYRDAVLAGEKTTTVRWDDPIAVGPAIFVFEDDPDHAHVTGSVASVNRYALRRLTAEQAGVAPDTDMDDYRRGLREHYPDMPDDAEVDVVSFTIDA